MTSRKKILRAIIPLLILGAGFACMQTLIQAKTPPAKAERPNIGMLVETRIITSASQSVQVHATGTVQSRLQADIVPQVSGRVVRVAPEFETGGFFRKGDLLFEIEAADYRLTAEKSRAEVVRTEYELAKVQSQARVARMEWERLQMDDKQRPNPLVLYEPQLKNAKASLAAAKADLEQSLLNIERTRVAAPFNGRIKSKSVDPGQYITAGQVTATIAGTDTAEIVVPVPLKELSWLDIPRKDGDPGSAATVSIDMDGRSVSWPGRIDRSKGDVDPKSRMVRLVVTVDDPYALKNSTHPRPPLDLAEGLFVEVTLDGHELSDAIAIPADALRQGSSVWVMDDRQRLDIRRVEVLRREKEKVLVRGDLATGEHVVLTQLSGAADGMLLRQAGEERS